MQPPPPLDLPNGRPFLIRIRIAIFGFLFRLLVDTVSLPLILRRQRNCIRLRIETGSTGRCRLCIYTPPVERDTAPKRGVIVHLHGGGWTIGHPENESPLCRYLCDTLGVVVVAPDYRKAPRYPYPHALEQSYSVLAWIASGGLSLELENHEITTEIDATRIALSGGSAGSNLAASLTLLTLTRPLPYASNISGLALLYPVLNLEVPYAEKLARVDPDRVLPPWMSRFFLLSYLPPPRVTSDPYVSPALAPRSILARLPPTAVLSAAYDYLAHEADDFAEVLLRNGVRVIHKHFKNVGHAFDGMPAMDRHQRALNASARKEAWGIIMELFQEVLAK